ncbi:hypothetical protein DFH09DRAFT_230495 [Mycena vulgaris]|nr:hypothetical protein DFH09DRAFT_230495 [Mycena vulgaris]
MKLVAILVSFGFSGSVLALNNSSHPEIVAAISSLGDQVSEISSILGALPVPFPNNTDPLASSKIDLPSNTPN